MLSAQRLQRRHAVQNVSLDSQPPGASIASKESAGGFSFGFSALLSRARSEPPSVAAHDFRARKNVVYPLMRARAFLAASCQLAAAESTLAQAAAAERSAPEDPSQHGRHVLDHHLCLECPTHVRHHT